MTLLIWSCESKTSEKVISITDNRLVGYPEKHTNGHKDKDLEIFRLVPDTSLHSKEAYVGATFRTLNNQLKFDCRFIYGTNEVYDKVSYRWDNDTIAIYRLFNSETKASLKLSITLQKIYEQSVNSVLD